MKQEEQTYDDDLLAVDDFEDVDNDYINSFLDSATWYSDVDVEEFDSEIIDDDIMMASCSSSYQDDLCLLPGEEEIFQDGLESDLVYSNCDSNPLAGVEPQVFMPEAAAPPATIDFASNSPEFQQELQLKLSRLAESMRRSEITRSQIIRQREAMAQQQQFNMQSMQNLAGWLSGRSTTLTAGLEQSRRQLQSYMTSVSRGGMM